jgi:kynurenine formamidase
MASIKNERRKMAKKNYRWQPPKYSVDENGKIIGYVNKDPNNWGKWGADDEKGATNYITPQIVAKAARLIKKGKLISLMTALDRSAPLLRGAFDHSFTMTSSDTVLRSPVLPPGLQVNDDQIVTPTHFTTHWDALAHFAWEDAHYNGFWAGGLASIVGVEHLGIQNLASTLVGRGVLLDIAKYKGVDRLQPGYAITPKDLDGAAAMEKVGVSPGDILIVRTGHMGWWYSLIWDKSEFWKVGEPGMSLSTIPWLNKKQVAAIAVDNIAAEVSPVEDPNGPMCPFHIQAIRNLGIIIGELFWLEDLSADCARDKVYEFFLSAPPLKITNAVGSPVNPMAIK